VNSDNIISVNIPNGISILIMVFIGGLALAFGRKALGGKSATGAKSQAVFTS
jgi:hypothetical protein